MFRELRELIDDERTQLVLWHSVIVFLMLVLLGVLGCTAPISNAQSGRGLNRLSVGAGADPAVEDNRSATSKPIEQFRTVTSASDSIETCRMAGLQTIPVLW